MSRKVIDVHTHIAPFPDEPDPIADETIRLALQVMKVSGVEKMIDLNGSFGDRLEANLNRMETLAPSRFVVLTNLDYSTVNDPGFPKLAMENLERARDAGARGLKIFKDLGLGYRDQQRNLIRVDDRRFDAVWTKCGELQFPVWIHVADPAAFFRPPTPDNERYEELKVHPEWSFYGEEYPSREELLSQWVRILAHHPETTFVGVHFGNSPENHAYVATLLDRFPNLVIDISARLGEIGRHDPAKLQEFFIRYQDRILFGTDIMFNPNNIQLGVPTPGTRTAEDARQFYEIHWRFLETDTREMEHPSPIQGNWKINAIDLPEEILKKIYYENIANLLPGV